jgi:hypothetical protein
VTLPGGPEHRLLAQGHQGAPRAVAGAAPGLSPPRPLDAGILNALLLQVMVVGPLSEPTDRPHLKIEG